MNYTSKVEILIFSFIKLKILMQILHVMFIRSQDKRVNFILKSNDNVSQLLSQVP